MKVLTWWLFANGIIHQAVIFFPFISILVSKFLGKEIMTVKSTKINDAATAVLEEENNLNLEFTLLVHFCYLVYAFVFEGIASLIMIKKFHFRQVGWFSIVKVCSGNNRRVI